MYKNSFRKENIRSKIQEKGKQCVDNLHFILLYSSSTEPLLPEQLLHLYFCEKDNPCLKAARPTRAFHLLFWGTHINVDRFFVLLGFEIKINCYTFLFFKLFYIHLYTD